MWTFSHPASVIVRTPLDLPLIQQHQKKNKKNPLKIKLRPSSTNNNNKNNNESFNGEGGNQQSNWSDDSINENEPGRNIKAALFTYV